MGRSVEQWTVSYWSTEAKMRIEITVNDWFAEQRCREMARFLEAGGAADVELHQGDRQKVEL